MLVERTVSTAGTHAENGYKCQHRSFESSDELDGAYGSNVDEDFRASDSNTDTSGRHSKFPHREQNPAVDVPETHALMVVCNSRDDRNHGVSQDHQNAAACLLQGFCRGKLWRSSWMLECAILRKGTLLSWILAHSEAEKVLGEAEVHQTTVQFYAYTIKHAWLYFHQLLET
jgi:hypothetical protein